MATPEIAAAMLFYFLAGYLTIGMIFLAVGLIRDSMQEAQAYLMPLALVIAVPSAGLASVIFRDPNGLVPRIFSWIPLYTPVTMLARLQSGVSRFELFGTAAVLLVFGALRAVRAGSALREQPHSDWSWFSPHRPTYGVPFSSGLPSSLWR